MSDSTADIARLIIDRSLLIQIGQGALYLISKRTLAGKFLPGSIGGSKYSTTPLPLPAGALTKKGIRQLNVLLKSEEATAFRSKSGRLWIVLQQGYKQLRELAGRETDRVTLNWTGAMMRGLNVKGVDTSIGSVDLGWTDPKLEKIASYHNTEGAGKSKVTHKFMGLQYNEIRQLNQRIEKMIKPG